MDTKQLTSEALAEIIVRFARENDVEPDEDFTADAGRDYGYVAAWGMPGDGNGYAVQYGDNGETNYYIASDASDLGQWLIHDNLSGTPEALIEAANVYGLDSLPDVEANNANGYAVMVSRNFYGPRTEHDLARDDHGDVVEYATLAEAQEAADEMDDEDYVTANSENGRPTYTVVAL